jgi:hypothetical protein
MQERSSAASARHTNPGQRSRAEQVVHLRGHPALAELAFGYCTAMTAEPVRWPLPKLLNQVARYEICFFLIANHARWRRSGGALPTLAATKALPQASPRQVADFVAGLRRMGLVTATPAPDNRRVLLLQPSPRLIHEVGRHPRLVVGIHATIHGQPHLQQMLEDPEHLQDLLMHAAEVETKQPMAQMPFPIIGYFARHDCGYLVLTALLHAHYAGAAHQPGYAALMSRFGISRAHLAHLLHEARQAGWLEMNRDTPRLLHSAVVREFEHFLAEQALHFGTLADMLFTSIVPAQGIANTAGGG